MKTSDLLESSLLARSLATESTSDPVENQENQALQCNEGGVEGETVNAEGRSQSAEIWLSVSEVVPLLGCNAANVRKALAADKYTHRQVTDNGGLQYRVLLSSLPEAARKKHFLQSQPSAAEQAEQIRATNALIQKNAMGKVKLIPERITAKDERLASLDRAWAKASAKQRAKAQAKTAAVVFWLDAQAQGFSQAVAAQMTKDALKVSQATLYRDFAKCEGQDRSLWPTLLLANPGGHRPLAEFTEAAWQFIQANWLTPHKPMMSVVIKLARQEGVKHGWVIPHNDTVEARLKAIPHDEKMWARGTAEERKRIHPYIERDYTTLVVHEYWNSDGRKLDVWVKFPDGEVVRPIVLLWQDIRTRCALGWAIGKTETAELVRLSFKNAVENCGYYLPQVAYMDNGRAFAAKQNTGGTVVRNRWEKTEGETAGSLTLLQVESRFVLPYNGQSKPIESWWKNIAAIEPLLAEGAYTGNKTDNKPDEADKKNAIPLADIEAVMLRVVKEVNGRIGHRGQGMARCSSDQLYTELMKTAQPRIVTKSQLNIAMLANKRMKLTQNGVFTVLGNSYYCDALSQIDRAAYYIVRYDPADLRVPIEVYDTAERHICTAPLRGRIGFADQAAAKELIKARQLQRKGVALQVKARELNYKAHGVGRVNYATPVGRLDGQPARAKVAELVNTGANAPKQNKPVIAAYQPTVLPKPKSRNGGNTAEQLTEPADPLQKTA